MNWKNVTLQALVIVMLVSCGRDAVRQAETEVIEPRQQYVYEIGLGYGFLDKEVQVIIDGREVFSLIGTEEIEKYAQMQGTNMLASGSSAEKEIIVQVIIDGGEPYEQVIDLSAGRYVHVYLEREGLSVYNTAFLLLE